MTSVDGLRPAPVARRSQAAALLGGLVRACRPKQWVKNVLVVAAPGAAGVLLTPRGGLLTAVAFAALCLAASGTYLINDAADAEADRAHPVKRLRPVAAGLVPVRAAAALGVLLVLGGIAAGLLAGPGPAAVVGGYVALTTAYTFRLKHLAVLDLLGVAAGFVIRAVAGAVAVGVPISIWFYVVVSLGSLFVVAGKRAGELRHAGTGSRATLTAYSAGYLGHVQAMSSGAMIVTYSLWVFQLHDGVGLALLSLSIVPFIAVVLRYALLVDNGHGEAPEELLFRDRQLLITGLVLVGLLVAGTYAN
ncbi:decaprenyl-phosphate phosphoribosyltransferase [Nonomuraea sp. NPDC050783]|uniref:decaprenyl-phosphate phosphoribosyltransferase n=1 Tax=Nonomuraea sp. NPDC050783 TaxID=3154634 RepID=UPI003467D34D